MGVLEVNHKLVNKINKLVDGMKDLIMLLTEGEIKIKDMDFGEALRAMKAGKAVSMWHRDSIYVYMKPAEDDENAELRVKTITGRFAAWTPNHQEIISGIWRIVEPKDER